MSCGILFIEMISYERKRERFETHGIAASAVAAGAAATIAGGLVTGVVVYHAVHPSGQAGEIYDVLRQADSISQKYFVGEDYDTDDLINGALTGYAQGLGDRWTSYMIAGINYQSYRESSAIPPWASA